MKLIRNEFSINGIFGNLYDDNDHHIACTLEHAYPVDDTGLFEPKIQAGDYVCKRRFSPHFGYDVFELIDVPGHDFIEIHVGNIQADSSGCILLGQERIANGLIGSRMAFSAFMIMLNGVAQFPLQVS